MTSCGVGLRAEFLISDGEKYCLLYSESGKRHFLSTFLNHFQQSLRMSNFGLFHKEGWGSSNLRSNAIFVGDTE